MSDTRTLLQKLEAMSTQNVASPYEAEIARRILGKPRGSGRTAETQRVLSREEILGAPDRDSPVAGVKRVRLDGIWYELDADEIELLKKWGLV